MTIKTGWVIARHLIFVIALEFAPLSEVRAGAGISASFSVSVPRALYIEVSSPGNVARHISQTGQIRTEIPLVFSGIQAGSPVTVTMLIRSNTDWFLAVDSKELPAPLEWTMVIPDSPRRDWQSLSTMTGVSIRGGRTAGTVVCLQFRQAGSLESGLLSVDIRQD